MSEKEHLGALCQITNDIQGRECSCIIAINKDVVKDHRAGRNSPDVVLNRGQTQSKIELVAGAITQSFNRYLFSVLSNRYQNRPVIISKTSSETRMVAKC